MLTLESVELLDGQLEFFFDFVCLLPRLLLIFYQFVASCLPLNLLLLQIVPSLLVLFEQADDGSIKEIHDVVSQLPRHSVGVCF